jgi:pimeloyl-ACP methyl ester carboxylesterase
MRILRLVPLLSALPVLAEYAQVNGVKMYYEIHGQGRPVVLLHGGMNSIQTSFAKQIAVFAQHHRVIAIDQMGHGRTPDVAGRALSYEGMSEDTAALLVYLGVRNADLVGWSDGGQIALRLAFTHPELVRRVVASGVGLGATPEMAKEFSTADMSNWFPAGRVEYARVSPDGPAHWSVYVEKARAMWSRSTWGFSESDLAKIDRPVLIAAGDRDAVNLDGTLRIFHVIPKARLCILPGTGHGTFQDRAEWLNPIVLDFLDRE